jgi:hypothetical protein
MAMHPVVAILICGAAEIYIGSMLFERLSTNAGLLETTATVISEPEYVVIDQTKRYNWNKESGYQFMYRYEVDGHTYTGSGRTTEKPGQTAPVYYSAASPSNSRPEKERTGALALFMLLIGAGLVWNALRIDWRGVLGRR